MARIGVQRWSLNHRMLACVTSVIRWALRHEAQRYF